MYKKIKLILFLSFGLLAYLKPYAQLSLYYEEFGINFTPQKCLDTLTFNSVAKFPNSKLVIYLSSCKGESSFKLYNSIGTIILTGSFANATDTLVKYQLAKERGMPMGKKRYRVLTIRYLYPLKQGIWTYYDNKGNTIRREEWDYIID